MGTTLTNVSIAFNLNAKGVVDGSKLARNEMGRLKQIFREQENEAERLNRQLIDLDNAYNKGAIGTNQYLTIENRLTDALHKTTQAYRDEIKAVKDAETATVEAARKQKAAMDEGIAVTQRYLTVEQRHAQEVANLNRLHSVGAIDAKTYNRAMSEQNDLLTKGAKKTSAFGTQLKAVAATYLSIQGARLAFNSMLESIESIDTLANTANALGESAGRLNTFQYALQQIANLDASSAEKFLTKMSQKVGEATLGNEAAIKSFTRLGISVDTLVGLSPVAQFEAFAGAIRKIEDPTQRVAIAMQLFGREGAHLLPLLTATTAEYERELKAAEQLGLNIKAIDVKQIQEADDAINKMKTAWSGFVNELTISSAPSIVALSEITTTVIQLKRELESLQVLGFKPGKLGVSILQEGPLGIGAAAVRDIRGITSGDSKQTLEAAIRIRERFGSGIFPKELNAKIDAETKKQLETANKQRQKQIELQNKTNELLERAEPTVVERAR